MKNYAVLNKDLVVDNSIVAASLDIAESVTSSSCVLITLGTSVDIGYSYADGYFYSPQPYPSWTRNQGNWQAPTPMPTDDKSYFWDEENLVWVQLEKVI